MRARTTFLKLRSRVTPVTSSTAGARPPATAARPTKMTDRWPESLSPFASAWTPAGAGLSRLSADQRRFNEFALVRGQTSRVLAVLAGLLGSQASSTARPTDRWPSASGWAPHNLGV